MANNVNALGSPLREICTAGSERGNESKKICRLGEGTAMKMAENSEAPQRLKIQGSFLPHEVCSL